MDYEVIYSYNGLFYKIIEKEAVHQLLSNDEDFAVQYFEENKSNLEVVGVEADMSPNPKSEELPTFTWDPKSVKLLIDQYAENQDAFRDPKVKKRPVWGRVEREFLRKGYKISADALDGKFRNMKKTFKTILDNNKKTTTGRGRISWPYYKAFEHLFKDDRTINFGHTISSSMQPPAHSMPGPSTSFEAQPPLNIDQRDNIFPSPNFSCTSPHTLSRATSSISKIISPILSPTPTPTSTVPTNILSHVSGNSSEVAPPPSTSTPKPQSAKAIRGQKLYELRMRQTDIEERWVQELKELKEAVLQSNIIQQRRNELLERLVVAQENRQ